MKNGQPPSPYLALALPSYQCSLDANGFLCAGRVLTKSPQLHRQKKIKPWPSKQAPMSATQYSDSATHPVKKEREKAREKYMEPSH